MEKVQAGSEKQGVESSLKKQVHWYLVDSKIGIIHQRMFGTRANDFVMLLLAVANDMFFKSWF
jgi:hypothetical protein